MYTPHTVTVYNTTTETDPATFADVTSNNITVLRGVFLDSNKGYNVRATGLETADSATLYIPFSTVGVDGVTGAEKTYADPVSFWNAPDKSGLWTLSTDGNTFFVKGEVVEPGKSSVYINSKYGYVYDVTKCDRKDFGSADMQHFEAGGKA